ncbi:hypothetical protein V4C85_17520 [Ralstonia solanacearum]|uniref:hypothetical protein n=1 Tax=Ralstonia solanacearum TaxID=305 RepID=UPI000AF1CF0B|nr:hypothetical protein [Ralstonia solanacearum]MDB0528755.1 hypothetical protein [Ralstonia solanacearum]MDB0566808.1 hypothetical protein [Ralstonia solanacearum]MDB0576341.1 hypothetical protein [Ralstonia solanacearum]
MTATIRSVELKYLFGRIDAEDFDFYNAPSKTNHRIRQFSLRRGRVDLSKKWRLRPQTASDSRGDEAVAFAKR